MKKTQKPTVRPVPPVLPQSSYKFITLDLFRKNGKLVWIDNLIIWN